MYILSLFNSLNKDYFLIQFIYAFMVSLTCKDTVVLVLNSDTINKGLLIASLE